MARRGSRDRPIARSPDRPILQRVVIEAVHPEIDAGRFPIKRTVGDEVIVNADIHADGHDLLAAALRHRRSGERTWREVPMRPLGNDRWTARFTVGDMGRYEYTLEAWIDPFATWRDALAKKFGAGQGVATELLEGAEIVERSRRSQGSERSQRSGPVGPVGPLGPLAARLRDESIPEDQRVALALDAELAGVMTARADRRGATRYERVLPVIVDPVRARFGAWYEMFPRSAGTDPSRSATFAEAAARLPYIAGMGFDVLYLPPIHPIGRTFRKGPNNTLGRGPLDPGSPWAIGSDEGGHTAVEPGLGTLGDFERFVEAARSYGLEIALDLAYQTSPDHPYVREHPNWFRRRPDGTIRYAENPPKKYQDTYPFDFETEDRPALWAELKRIVEFWIQHGVKIFRVDNPHTKPYALWEWMLADLKRACPEAILLSEAFTRPKVMKYLAKLGFTQSYTYFTWRNTKPELTEYFTELTGTDAREYLRPNLFANTPDILHEYLQLGGRPAFEARLVLAATLGASYGIYSGFELAENVAVRPGSEEYLDSEKYQIRPRDFDRPDSLAPLITLVNRIRREHPALQRNRGLRFLGADNPQLIAYSKRSADGGDLIVVVVNLDPQNMQHGFVRLPIEEWGFSPTDTIEVADLLSGERYFWRGEWNYVRLDPGLRMAHILHVQLGRPLEEEPSEPER